MKKNINDVSETKEDIKIDKEDGFLATLKKVVNKNNPKKEDKNKEV